MLHNPYLKSVFSPCFHHPCFTHLDDRQLYQKVDVLSWMLELLLFSILFYEIFAYSREEHSLLKP